MDLQSVKQQGAMGETPPSKAGWTTYLSPHFPSLPEEPVTLYHHLCPVVKEDSFPAPQQQP